MDGESGEDENERSDGEYEKLLMRILAKKEEDSGLS